MIIKIVFDTTEGYSAQGTVLKTGSVGTELRRLRKNNRYNLRQAAEGAGLSVSFLSDMELGRSSPSVKTLEKLLTLYGVELILREVER